MTLHEDLLTEGEPEREFTPGIAARLPQKRVAAAALIRDPGGRVLFIDPTYKKDWVLPGGMVEAQEDPLTGCTRELLEELGLTRVPGRLLVVDWMPRHGVWGDSLQFIFDGGLLEPESLPELTLQADEVRSVQFVTPAQAQPHIRPSMFRRLVAALGAADTGQAHYLTYGRIR